MAGSRREEAARASFQLGYSGYVIVSQLKVEDRQVFNHAFLSNRLGESDHAALDHPTQDNLPDGLAVLVANPILCDGCWPYAVNANVWNFVNNIIANFGTGNDTDPAGPYVAFSNNPLFGNHPSGEPADAHKIITDPLFVAPSSTATEAAYTRSASNRAFRMSEMDQAGGASSRASTTAASSACSLGSASIPDA